MSESDVEHVSRMIRSSGHKLRRLSRFGKDTIRDRALTSIGPLLGEDWGVHRNSVVNLERAIVERVMLVDGNLPPQPLRTTLMRRLNRFTYRLMQVVDPVEQITTKEFVETYFGRKKTMYQAAVDSLVDNPISESDAIVSAFIKDEKINVTRKTDPCPRIIQPRAPRFNAAIGVYLKPLEKAIFKGIASIFRGTTVLKGYNAIDRATLLKAKWDKFDDPVAILLDAKRFDQHVSRELLDWEQFTFRRLLMDPDGFEMVNKLRRKNRCYARAEGGGFAYELNGKRMSGDMDTALGNCLSMCAMTWSFMTDVGISNYEYANDGDDGVLIVEKAYLNLVMETYSDYFHELGFTMKLEGLAHMFEEIEFCQCHPVWDGEQYRMVRNPDIALMKDSLTLKSGNIHELRNAVGWGGLALAGSIPICGEYYRRMVSGSDNRDPHDLTCGRDYLALGLIAKYRVPTDESRVSFYYAFGITPDTQIAIEHAIREHPINHTVTPIDVSTFSGSGSLTWW